MTDETQRLLGELKADVRALRLAQERHEKTTDEMREDVVLLRIEVGKIKDEHGGGGLMRGVVAAVLGALAGFGGGHTSLPGGH